MHNYTHAKHSEPSPRTLINADSRLPARVFGAHTFGTWIAAMVLACCVPLSGPLCAAEGGGGEPGLIFDGHEARPDRLIARFLPELPTPEKELKKKLENLGVSIVTRSVTVPGLTVLQLEAPVEGGEAAGKLAARIKSLVGTGWFQYVEPDWVVRAVATPTDAAFLDGRLWGLRNTGQSGGLAGADIDAVDAWNITTGSASVVVAVIDSGIRFTHQDLAANMWVNANEVAGNGIDDDGNGYIDDVHGINSITGTGNPMDDNDHGTHCAGTIGAVANGGGPHVGVAWNVRLMGLKFLSANGSGSISNGIECVDYAVARGARVLSNSWGGGGYSQGLYDSIVAARNAGALFVAAAGNESSNNDQVINYPSNYDVANVVAVAALDRNDQLASFSNYGLTTVDLGAPGVAIYSSTAGSDTEYSTFDGTSMATPHVAGAAALLVAAHPAATYTELKLRLLSGARPVSSLAGKSVTGATLDARSSLTVASDGILEIRAGATPNPLRAGGTVNTFVTLTDLAPVTGATVDARFGTKAYVRLQDNGTSPDAVAGDGVYSAPMSVPTGTTNVLLHVEASAPGKTPGSADFTFPIAVPPPNDNLADRTLVAAGSTQSVGSNVDASAEAGEPRNPSVAGGRSVWWSWTSATSSSVTISTTGSSFDTTLAIYTGNTVGSLVLVGANDDAGGVQSAVTFAAVAGTTYSIQVDGYSSATGTIALNHPQTGAAPGAPVIVTNPANASVLAGQPFSLQVVAQGDATLAYQWYQDGGAVNGATSAVWSKPTATLGDEGEYQVLVSNSKGAALSAVAYLAVEQTAIIPENDDFPDAAVITGASGRVRASNRLATGEAGETNHAAASTPLASVWWKWTATADGDLTLDTFGSSFDTTLAAYTGAAVGTLAAVASANDSDGTVQSRISFPVTAGQSYSIAIDGAGSAEGAIVFNYLFVPDSISVPNDNFAARTLLGSGPAAVSGSNIGATGEAGETDHIGRSIPLASAWWSWTAPATGTVVIDTNGSDFDTTLAVYSGGSVNGLLLVGGNDDGGTGTNSSVSLAVQAGDVLQIAVDGFGSEQGSTDLNVSFIPGAVQRPGNDNFASAFLIAPGIELVTGNNEFATGETGEPVHHNPSVSPLNSVWWRWTAPINGTLTVNLAGSTSTANEMDTVLAVYQGSAVNALSLIASNDDNEDNENTFTSKAIFPVTAGQTYHIAVDGYDDATGDIRLNLALAGSAPAPTLAVALDQASLPWSAGDGTPWTGMFFPSHDGIDSARSGAIGDSSESWLQTSVTGPGALDFWWRADSEEDFDLLEIRLDATPVASISGATGWLFRSVPIPAGSHVVRWTYSKDSSFAEGLDAGFVDQVSFMPTGFLGWIGTYPSIPVPLQGPLADADADGMENLVEYYQNTSPSNGRERGGISVPVVTASGPFTAHFRRNKNAPDVTGTVQWSPNLSQWASSGQAVSGTIVTLVQSVDSSPVDHDIVTITGSITGAPLKGVFLRLSVLQN